MAATELQHVRPRIGKTERMRRLTLLLALLTTAISGGVLAGSATAASPYSAPKLGHVFVIVLENENADDTFGPDAPAYLRQTLVSKGAYVPNYYGTGHFSLDNYISMISGQAPNPQTQADCNMFNDFQPGTPAIDGQVVGTGCVYPSSVKTVADQLDSAGKDWGGYMEDMANGAPAAPVACRHPAIGAQDDTQAAEDGDQYATRHNPFMYFHSIIDDNASCSAHVVDYTKLAGDLKSEKKTPAFSFITPNLCHDGHDQPCVNGEPGGLVSMNDFLQKAVPPILSSPAYQDRGLLIVTFDEAEAGGASADSSACCNEQSGPNTVNPGFLNPGPGGGRVGAVMMSPCIKPGTVSMMPYNHYSFLRSVEDAFGLDHLGYAGQDGLAPFGSDIYTQGDCGEAMKLKVKPKHPSAGGKLKAKVKSQLDRCRAGVKVKAPGDSAKTNAKGKATLKPKIGAKPVTVKASKKGCLTAKVKLTPR
jgi:hypothetical protein